MRQRSRRDDLAGCEWRIDLIARENIDEMTQCRNRSTQQIRSATVIKDRAVALQIDFEGRKRPAPISPKAATVSGAENCHPGKIDCTISKPCATQSTPASNVLSSIPGAGATASLKTISGSIRGSARPTSENASPISERLCTVRL